ncbi:hypothetical protein [Kitasatospora aureofaciens]|uniref:hypothetical protein n=1 Tax=Kitasatospora aureofaciens TaxID=1894 RepID=UPI000526B563|nr:hypothetical protein [Kitasatospora aureofaciens]
MAQRPSLDWLSRLRALLVRVMLSVQQAMAEEEADPHAARDPARLQADSQLLESLAATLHEVTEAINTYPAQPPAERAHVKNHSTPLAEVQQGQTWKHRTVQPHLSSDTAWPVR